MRAVARRFAAAATVFTLTGCSNEQAVRHDGAPTPSPIAATSAAPTTSGSPIGDAGERVGIRMTVDDWLGISNDLDSTSSVGYEGGDVAEAGKAVVVGAAGDQQATQPHKKSWLPKQRAVTFVLSRAQWLWTADQVEHWSAVSDTVDQPQEAADGRRVAALIRSQLATARAGKQPRPGPLTLRHYLGNGDDHELYLTPYDAPAAPYDVPDTSVDHVLKVTSARTCDVLTLLTGRTYTHVDLTVHMLSGPPQSLNSAVVDGWSVGEEATARITEPLVGLGTYDWQAPDIVVPGRPGLYRVRVLARDRVHDDAADYDEYPDGQGRATERFDVTLWPVAVASPPELLGSDAGGVRISVDG
jgi:hypothetical protein